MGRLFKNRFYKLPVIAGMAIAILGMNTGVVSAEECESEPEECPIPSAATEPLFNNTDIHILTME